MESSWALFPKWALPKTSLTKTLRCKAKDLSFVQKLLNNCKQGLRFNFRKSNLDVSKCSVKKQKWSYGQRCLENLNQFIRNLCCWIPYNNLLQVVSKWGQDKKCSWSRNPLFKGHGRELLPGRHGKECSCTFPISFISHPVSKGHSQMHLLSY